MLHVQGYRHIQEWFTKLYKDEHARDEVKVRSAIAVDLRRASTDEPDVDETRRLRRYLKLYFYSAFKLKSNTCFVHLIYCALMVIQIVKVAVITDQMFLFGYDRSNFNSIVNRGHTTLQHLLLKGWDARWETLPYPPAHGDFALYNIADLTASIDYAINRYYNSPVDAIGYYKRLPGDAMSVKMDYYDFGGFGNDSVSGTGDLVLLSKSFPIHPHNETDSTTGVTSLRYSIDDGFKENNLSEPIKRLLRFVLSFTLHSVRIDYETSRGRCLHVHGKVSFSDLENNGQVLVNLDTLTTNIPCHTMGYNIEDASLERASNALGATVMLFCTLSIVVTVVTMVFAGYVFMQTKAYMKKNYQCYYKPPDDSERDLPPSEYLRFLKYWDIVCIVGDILILSGTSWVVFLVEDENYTLDTMDKHTFWLGVGCILCWVCLLRYFKFHNKFNLLFTTIYRSMGKVMAYLMCVCVLFVGFWVAGYVVLGPYHVKFSTPDAAASTLFSIVHGDELYATLYMLEDRKAGSDWIWWFSRIYLFTYVAIFTVVVINILIAIVLSAYDVIQEYYKEQNEDRDLGPVEKAIRTFLASRAQADAPNTLRASLCDLMAVNNVGHLSREEDVLRTELKKLVRVSATDKGIVLYKRRTLKAFIEDDADAPKVYTIGCCKFSFASFSTKETD